MVDEASIPNPGQPDPKGNPTPPPPPPQPALQRITQWIESKGGVTHMAAGAVATSLTLYYAVPPFHQLVITAYQQTPPWTHNVLEAAIAIYAFYRNPAKKEQ